MDVEKMSALISKLDELGNTVFIAKTALTNDDRDTFLHSYYEALGLLDTVIDLKASLSL